MNPTIEWILGEAEKALQGERALPHMAKEEGSSERDRMQAWIESLPAHSFPGKEQGIEPGEGNSDGFIGGERAGLVERICDLVARYENVEPAQERERRIYRGRTVGLLRRYMSYSMETGRLPSVLGQEFFRAKVTSYNVVTFEDRVIFVHDMERCLEKLDGFSRELIARRVLQEHDRWATARLMQGNEKTVRRLTPIALDLLAEILLDRGLLHRLEKIPEKSCQGGSEAQKIVSDYEQSKNNF
jgi:hypothetical protein